MTAGFNFYCIPSFIAALLLLALAGFVYNSNRRSPTNITFALECFTSFIWQFSYGMMYLYSFDKDSAFIWMKIGYVGVIYISVFYYHFIVEFLGLEKERPVVYVSYFIATVFAGLNLTTSYFTDGLIKYGWGYYPKASGLHPLFLVFFVGLICMIIAHTFYAFLKRDQLFSDRRKEQVQYLFWAYFLYSPACIDFLANYGIGVYPFGYLFATMFLAIIAYAIVRHQLMDIEVIIKKTIVFAGLFTFVYAVFAGIAYLSQIVLEDALGLNRWFAMVPSVLIVILSLKPLETFLVNKTDKYLFQRRFSYKELLKSFTGDVLTVLDLEELVDSTVNQLMSMLKIEACAVLLFDEDKQHFFVKASNNIKNPSVILPRPGGIVTFMDETRGHILVRELEERNISIPEPIKEMIDDLSAELIIPMVLHDNVIGALALGKKKSDEDYSQDDIDILLPLARTLAIALSNAELFDKLGKAQAEAAQKEKMAVIGTLSAGINHEICNPLGIARGQCEAFLLNFKDGLYADKSPEELLQRAKDIMGKVIKETDRATAITKKLSSFAKPAKGESEYVNVEKEIDEVIGLVNYELKLDKIVIEKALDKELPDIFADRKQFQEALFNLIRNAAQAIGEKGRITVTAKEDVQKVSIDIRDTGSGIPEDKKKQLFNPFFTTKEPGKGTGLGLFIVRQVVEKNGGRIYLKETRVGQGTTFTLEFPSALSVGGKV